eukprot:922126-Amorphochlora_amoeboformis.AAC.1
MYGVHYGRMLTITPLMPQAEILQYLKENGEHDQNSTPLANPNLNPTPSDPPRDNGKTGLSMHGMSSTAGANHGKTSQKFPYHENDKTNSQSRFTRMATRMSATGDAHSDVDMDDFKTASLLGDDDKHMDMNSNIDIHQNPSSVPRTPFIDPELNPEPNKECKTLNLDLDQTHLNVFATDVYGDFARDANGNGDLNAYPDVEPDLEPNRHLSNSHPQARTFRSVPSAKLFTQSSNSGLNARKYHTHPHSHPHHRLRSKTPEPANTNRHLNISKSNHPNPKSDPNRSLSQPQLDQKSQRRPQLETPLDHTQTPITYHPGGHNHTHILHAQAAHPKPASTTNMQNAMDRPGLKPGVGVGVSGVDVSGVDVGAGVSGVGHEVKANGDVDVHNHHNVPNLQENYVPYAR